MDARRLAAPLASMAVLATLGAAPARLDAATAKPASRDWPGFRGPAHTAAVEGSGLFDGIDAPGLEVAWTAGLGSGYSGVTVVDGRAFTAFAAGAEDVVAAFDAASGRELWRAPLGPAYPGHDGSHDGPIATPAADARRVYALGPRGRLVALDSRTGALRWSHDLAKDPGAVAPYYGWASSPLLTGACAVVQHGVKDRQAVACFDRETGRVRWTAGAHDVSYQSPILATLAGRQQIVAADEKRLYGLDPVTGAKLWEHDHGGDGSPMATGSLVPLAVEGDRLLITPRDDAAVLLRVKNAAGAWSVEPVWTSKGLRTSYSRPVYHRGFFFGYAGAFLACVDAASGETRWRSRAPGDGFLALVDGRLVVQTKTGSLHVAEASPEGYRELAQLQAFTDHSWTAPSVAAGRLFARGMSQVMALNVVNTKAGPRAVASGSPEPPLAPRLPLGPRMAGFLEQVGGATDKASAVDAFLASVASFPLIEGDVVEFLYRGPGSDLGILGDVIGARAQRPMQRVEGTDLFYWSARVRPLSRLAYRFVRDLDENVPDPRNPRREPGGSPENSWFAMPGWEEPAFLAPAPAERRGRIETHEIESGLLKAKRRVDVYLPAGYDASSDRLPVVYVHGGERAIEGGLPNVLDQLVGRSAPLMVVAFAHNLPPPAPGTQPAPDLLSRQSDSLADEVVPLLDRTYRTRPDRKARALFGAGFDGLDALDAAFRRPEVFGYVSTQSAFMLTEGLADLKRLVEKASSAPDSISLEWSAYDLRADHEGWNNIDSNRALAAFLKERSLPVTTREVSEGFSWGSWRNRAQLVFGGFFD